MHWSTWIQQGTATSLPLVCISFPSHKKWMFERIWTYKWLTYLLRKTETVWWTRIQCCNTRRWGIISMIWPKNDYNGNEEWVYISYQLSYTKIVIWLTANNHLKIPRRGKNKMSFMPATCISLFTNNLGK